MSWWDNNVEYAYRTGVAADLATQHKFNIFTISKGDALVMGISGKVTFQKAGTAQTLELGFTPTGGARTIIGIASATTTGDVANKFYTWDGIAGSQIVVAQTGDAIGFGVVGSVLAGTSGAINAFCPGTFDITTAAADDAQGLVDWYIWYKPLTPYTKVAAV